MRRSFIFSEGEYYHLYNRGVDKRNIFEDDHDYNRFILLLYLCNSNNPVDIGNLFTEGRSFSDVLCLNKGRNIVAIGSYVLMPNHFHILIKEITDGGVSKFMGKLLTGYSMYFNGKHGRSGSLFEGRFRATHVDKNEYLKYLFTYIHLNPVKLIEPNWKEVGVINKETVRKHLNSYKYSSYLDYINESRLEHKVLDKNSFPDYFSFGCGFTDFVEDWLAYKDCFQLS